MSRTPTHVQWNGPRIRLTAVYAPGEPGFSVESAFLGDDGREVRCAWPADATAALVAQLDQTLGFRPMAARGT
jgi:hypothetical protein